MMAREIVLGRISRLWAGVLVTIGFVYAAANVAVFLVTISRDAFAIFDLSYIVAVVFVFPAIVILGSIVAAVASKRFDWLGTVGFSMWTGCVAFAHLWVIAQCSASV